MSQAPRHSPSPKITVEPAKITPEITADPTEITEIGTGVQLDFARVPKLAILKGWSA